MSRITFTKEIVQDAQRLVEQLNLMMTQVDSVSKPVNALRAQVTNINNTITGMGVVKIQNNAGSLIGTRDTLQFLNGSLISWNIIDDPVNARVQIAPIVSGAHDLTAGTSLQITAGTGVGAVLQNLTLNTIQGIRTSDSPTFAGIFLTGMEIIFGGNTIRMFDVTDTFYSSFSLATLTANRGLTVPNASGVIATLDGGQTFTVANWQATTIGIAYGGTGQATAVLGFNALSPLTTKGDVLAHDGTNNVRLGIGTNGYVLSADSAEVTGLKWIAMAAGSPLTTKGDIFVYSTVDDRLPVGTDTYILSADSTTATGLKWIAPSGASSHDVLSATHTDTLVAAVVLGDIIHGNATPKWARLAGNITTTKKWLSQTGTGAVSAAPAWDTLVDADIPDILTLTKISNLTTNGFVKTSGGDGTLSVDTNTYLTENQTITLSGDVTGSGATAITTTYAGTVPVSKGGTGATSFTAGSVIFMGATTFAQDNANFFWDDTNNRLGIGTVVPSVRAEVWSQLLLTDNTNTSSTAFPAETNVAAVLARTGYNGTPSASIALGALNHDAVNDGTPFRYILSTDGGAAATGLVFSKETWAASVITRTALMRLNATGLGIGVSPNAKLTVGDGTVTCYINPASTIAYIGNTSNHPLGLITNNVERIRITNTGLVGIGAAPTYNLDVVGNGFRLAGSSFPSIYLENSGGRNWRIFEASSFNIRDNTAVVDVFTIDGSQRIGFSKTGPTALLHIGTVGTLGHIRMDGIVGNPASPTDGDHWYNTTQESHRFRATVGTQGLVGLVYAAPDTSNSVSNTTTETDFDNNYTLPASSLTVGKSVRVKASGVWGQISGTVQFKVYVGANTVYDTGNLTLTPSGTEAWYLECNATIRTTGVSGVGRGCGFAIMGLNRYALGVNTDADTTINTTATAIVKVSVKFNTANAGNNAKMTNLTIEVLD